MIRKATILTFLFLSFVLATKGQPVVDSIETGPGPEDMVWVPNEGKGVLLISCTERRKDAVESGVKYGEIEQFDLETSQVNVLERKGHPDEVPFFPHGVFYKQLNGTDYLYVISHPDHDNKKGKQFIIRYVIHPGFLTYDAHYHHPLITSPNALVVMDNGDFFVCNDRKKHGSKIQMVLRRGSVIHYSAKNGYTKQAKCIRMAAGINYYDGYLYIAAVTSGKLWKYKWDEQQKKLSKKELATKIKGPDNIRIHDEQLLIAHHLKWCKLPGYNRKGKPSPTAVTLFNPETGMSQRIHPTEKQVISGGSTAILRDGKLYICQIIENFIVAVPMQ